MIFFQKHKIYLGKGKKTMKKLTKIILSLLMVLSVSACSTSNTDDDTTSEAMFTAGTYACSAKGNNGDVELEVTFSDNAIDSINVTAQAETAGLGDTAIENIIAEILENQTLAVDTVTGATNSSNAVINAVKDCVTQAGGDVEAFSQAVAETEKQEETLEADVVVVGGGGAGLTAAIKAAEEGLNVILVEKTATLGGALGVSGGNQVVSGSSLQEEAGVTNDNVETMVADFKANGANLNVDELITLYAENVGTATDWLNSYVGVAYDMEGGLHVLAEYSVDRELAYEGGGSQAAATMSDFLKNTAATILTETRATKLLTTDGAVTGVYAEGKDANYTINASAVILATGGYGNNDDLLTEEMQNALYYGPASSTGDGIIMATAEDVNAATRLMEYGKRYPNGIEVDEGVAKSTINSNIAAFNEGAAILVNPEGKRVVNEKASNREILTVELEQEGQMLYVLMDAPTFATYKEKLATTGVTAEAVDEYLAANGTSTPIFATADTLEELAAIVNMDPATLTATVDTYNSYVEAGNDADFGRPVEYMNKQINEGPYYLVEQKPRFATTMGGLVVNTSLQVLNTNDEVIPGLYAAGETVGGVMGDDSPSGANNGWAVTSGMLAGESVAANITK